MATVFISTSIGVGRAAQGIVATGIASTGSVGTPTVVLGPAPQNIAAIGIGSGSSVGTPALSFNQDISASGIASTLSVGTPVLGTLVPPVRISINLLVGRTSDQTIAAIGIDPTAGFGLPGLAAGPVNIAAQGFGPSSSVGTPNGGNANPVFISTSLVVGRGGLSIQAIGVDPTGSVGQPHVFLGNLPLFVTSSFNVGLTIGQPVLPLGIGASTSVGLPAISTGSVNIAASGIASTTVVSTGLVVTLGGLIVAPLAIAPSVIFGLPTLSTGSVNIAAIGIPSTVSVGTGALIANTANINAIGFGSSLIFGFPILAQGDLVLPVGIDSTASVGLPRVYLGDVVVAQGFGPTSSVGTPAIQFDQFISAIGINPATQAGLPYVSAEVIIPPEDGPVLMPPYSGQSQPSHINVPAAIAYKEAEREEGCWVIPPYAQLYPQPEEPSVDVVPPPLRKSDLWNAMQTWPL